MAVVAARFAARHLPPLHSPLERAQAVLGDIARHRDEIDRECRLPESLVTRLAAAGLFGLVLPSWLGGDELEPAAYAAVIETVATADASTAWCLAQAAGCSIAAAYLQPDAAASIFGLARAVVAWGPPRQARAIDLGHGYLVSGQWTFASGCRHATWLGGHCEIVEADGRRRVDAQGRPVMRTMLFPADVAEIVPDWDVIGLRGTGSCAYSVTACLVPYTHAIARDDAAARRENGPLYRLTTNQLSGLGVAAIALGTARGALDDFVALAQAKTPRATTARLCDSAVVQSRLAGAEARLRAARAFLMAAADEAWQALDDAERLPAAEATGLRLAVMHAIDTAVEAVDFAYRSGGATTIFADHPLQRRFRDMHTLTQQIQARESHMESAGKALFGLEGDTAFL